MISVLDGVWWCCWSQAQIALFPLPTGYEAELILEQIWMRLQKQTSVRSGSCPVTGLLLYRLSYPGPTVLIIGLTLE
jgi:hypothetical protein